MSGLKRGLKNVLGRVRKLVTRDDSYIERPSKVSVGFLCDVCWKSILEHNDNYRCTDCNRTYNLCSACYRHGDAERHLEEFGPQHVIIKETEICYHGAGYIVGKTLEESFFNMFKYYPERPAIGEYDRELNNYRYTTFAELLSLVHKFYSGLDALMSEMELCSNFVTFCGNTSLQWYIADFACLFLGTPTVPIGVTVDPGNMAFILNQTEAGVLVCDPDMLDVILTSLIPRCPHLKCVIVMKTKREEDKKWPETLPDSVKFLHFEAVLKRGGESLVPLMKNKVSEEDILSIVYTSGSTGAPKGCVFTRKIYHMRTAGKLKGELNSSLAVWFSFQPPSHLLERRSTHYTLLKGGKVGIYRGSMDHIFEDIAFVRPTLFAATPRFYNVIYDQFQQTLKELTEKYRMEESVQVEDEDPRNGNTAVQQENTTKGDECTPIESTELTPEEKAYREAKDQFRDILGGRCLIIVTGGAATGKAVKNFLQDVMTLFVSDGYGTTEAGPVASNESIIAEDIKLVDVPEMGYLTTDDPPRGEVWVKNPTIIAGYYKNEQETEDKFQDGYFKTGDIAVRKGKDQIILIDRKKNIFKLAQGEFIAPSRLETIFTDDSQYIEHIFIYGQALWNNVIAVVVPYRSLTEQWWLQQHSTHPATFEEICESDDLREFVLQEIRSIAANHHLPGWEIPIDVLVVPEPFYPRIRSIAANHHLPGWEIPIDVLVVPEPFTPENGLLTTTYKPCRPQLELKYKSRLEDLYAAATSDGDLNNDTGNQFVNFVTSCFQAQTQTPSETYSVPQHFVTNTFSQLGCDSIAGLQAVNTLKRRLNVEIPIEKLLVCSVYQLVQFINTTTGKSIRNPDLVAAFEKASTVLDQKDEALTYPEIMYSDCNLDKWLKDESLVPEFNVGTGNWIENGSKNVLLTGSAGFLGRHILLCLLQDEKCGKVFCHLRRKSEGDLEDYLLEILRLSSLCDDEELHQLFKEKVVMLEGDLSKPLVGLEVATFDHLASTVDVIIHNGALVNHVLPYTSLRSTNVMSTWELLKMCFKGKPKFFNFISTSGILHGAPGGRGNADENADINEINVEILPGYSQTKWVSEQLIFKAVKQGFVRGAISRPGLIGPHTLTGEGNKRDWLHSLLSAILELGLLPNSSLMTSSKLHLIPVDYVAKAVVAVSLKENTEKSVTRDERDNPAFRTSCEVYHLVNSREPLTYSSLFQSLHCLHPDLQTSDYASFRSRLSEVATKLNSVILTTANSLLPLQGTEPPSTQAYRSDITGSLMAGVFGLEEMFQEVAISSYLSMYLKRYFGDTRS